MDYTDTLLYGKDPTDNIVGVAHQGNPFESEKAEMYVYIRENGSVRVEEDQFYPYFLTARKDVMRGIDTVGEFQLEGDRFYQYIFLFQNYSEYWNGIRRVRSQTGKDNPEVLYANHNLVSQYLTQSGRTMFKGMTLDDIFRMQIDIEVYTEGGFPNSTRLDDKIIIISISDNRGGEKIFQLGDYDEEADMLQDFVGFVRSEDPDVLEFHNGFGFDLPYLRDRCSMFNVRFELGRSEGRVRTWDSSRKFAERNVDFEMFDIQGRHIIDTYFQVMDYDVVKRDMPSHSLKDAAKYFGVAADDREYIEGDEISRVWRENPDRLLEYALDDVRETRAIADRLSNSSFYQTQIVPMDYQKVENAGEATKIESMFVRYYLSNNHSLPKAEHGQQEHGGYTDIFLTGVFGPISYADISSLYPTIMLHWDVNPSCDDLNVFEKSLEGLTDMRLDAKSKLQNLEKGSDAYEEMDARQNSYKILINSFYGMMGFPLAIFNDIDEADRVATTGQEILREMIAEIENDGGRVIECDTDGVIYIPPEELDTIDKQREYNQQLTERMPEGVEIDHEGSFDKMISYKKKNYILRDYDGNVKIKGSSLISRSLEPFGRDFIKTMFHLLLDENIEEMHETYVELVRDIRNRRWDISDFRVRQTLNDTIEDYQEAVELGHGNGGRHKEAAYELAIQDMEETGKKYMKGDVVEYYVCGSGSYKPLYENTKLAEEWDPENPDENTTYYIKERLDNSFCEKFLPFFTDADYSKIFNEPGLFKPDFNEIDVMACEV